MYAGPMENSFLNRPFYTIYFLNGLDIYWAENTPNNINVGCQVLQKWLLPSTGRILRAEFYRICTLNTTHFYWDIEIGYLNSFIKLFNIPRLAYIDTRLNIHTITPSPDPKCKPSLYWNYNKTKRRLVTPHSNLSPMIVWAAFSSSCLLTSCHRSSPP